MGQWVHRLSEIDPEARTGVCANCGPVRLKKAGSGWRCKVAWRACNPRPGQVGRSTMNLIECERCGFRGHPCQLDVHHRDHNHSNDDPANLEIVCANCHRFEHFA